MKHAEGNPDELKTKFWKALADSSFLFLQNRDDSSSAVPMSPQLDKDANSSIWFFTHDKSDFKDADVSPGDTVVFRDNMQYKIKIDGKEYFRVRSEDLLYVEEEVHND